jgi:hypothetical protein
VTSTVNCARSDLGCTMMSGDHQTPIEGPKSSFQIPDLGIACNLRSGTSMQVVGGLVGL